MAKLIGICGTLSTGKTTLARNLSNQLNMLGHITEYATEAATDYIIRCGAPKFIQEEYAVLLEQIRREEERCNIPSVKYVVCDCPVFLTHAYAIDMANYEDRKDRDVLYNIYRLVSEYIYKYDKIIYIPKIKSVVDNGIRQYDENDAARIDDLIKSVLLIYKIKYYELNMDQNKWSTEAIKIILN